MIYKFPSAIYTVTGWDRKYLKKEEDNLARERIDVIGSVATEWEVGVGGPFPTVGTFGISGIGKKQLF